VGDSTRSFFRMYGLKRTSGGFYADRIKQPGSVRSRFYEGPHAGEGRENEKRQSSRRGAELVYRKKKEIGEKKNERKDGRDDGGSAGQGESGVAKVEKGAPSTRSLGGETPEKEK